MKRHIIAAASIAAVLAFGCVKHEDEHAAVNDTATTTQETATTVTSPAGDTGAAAATTLAAADQDFVMKAAKTGMAEVQLATNVSNRATSPDVRNFAQKMMEDHNRANQELTTLAAGKHVDPPADIDPDKKALDAELAKLNGAELDKKYMDAMVKDHAAAVADFEKASQTLADPDLKAWAAKTLPVLQEHHHMAEQVKAKLK